MTARSLLARAVRHGPSGVRHRAAFARMFLERQALATLGRHRHHPGGRILCYHTVGEPSYGVNDVSPEQFRRHLELALEAGYRFTRAADVARGAGDDRTLAITFDDGMKSVVTEAAPIMRDLDVPWTVFVVTGWCDGAARWLGDAVMTWDDVEAAAAAGGEIGSHSVSHPDFATIDAERMVDELEGSRDQIRAHTGIAPEAFAIPFGQSANWSPEAHRRAVAAGYELVYAQAEQTRAPGTVGRTFVTRFDHDRLFAAVLAGVFDRWEEWV